MNRYETVFLSHQDLSEEDVEALTAQAVEIIQQNKGELIQAQQWGKKKLAYKVQKEVPGLLHAFGLFCGR